MKLGITKRALALLLAKAEQMSLFGAPRGEVKEPGKRGGKFHRTKTGKIRYGNFAIMSETGRGAGTNERHEQEHDTIEDAERAAREHRDKTGLETMVVHGRGPNAGAVARRFSRKVAAEPTAPSATPTPEPAGTQGGGEKAGASEKEKASGGKYDVLADFRSRSGGYSPEDHDEKAKFHFEAAHQSGGGENDLANHHNLLAAAHENEAMRKRGIGPGRYGQGKVSDRDQRERLDAALHHGGQAGLSRDQMWMPRSIEYTIPHPHHVTLEQWEKNRAEKEGAGMRKAATVGELVREHKRLVKVLRGKSRKGHKKEAKRQAAELAEMQQAPPASC